MKAILFLTLLLIILSCKKDEPVKSYLSEPPILKGFNIRDGNGVLMQKIGVPNVKYSEDPESEKKTFVYKTTINGPYKAFYVFFGDKSSNKYKVTVVRGIYGATDRYFRLREEGVQGWELLGYTTLGLLEGAFVGGLFSTYVEGSIYQTAATTSITSVPGLGYSVLDYHTFGLAHIGGLNEYIGKQTSKYPTVLTIPNIIVKFFSLL